MVLERGAAGGARVPLVPDRRMSKTTAMNSNSDTKDAAASPERMEVGVDSASPLADGANQQGKKSGYRRPVGDLTRFVAIVIDTNCYEKGHFNQGKVEGLAKRAAKKDVEVWVPGQVVVEWGRHAADDAKNSNTALGRLYRAGLLSASPVKAEDDATAVVDQLRKSVEAVENVRVLTERGDSATAAIRDQILGTGAGGVKSGIRTGAVDSAMVRDVEAEVSDLMKVIFMTNNYKDFAEAAAGLGHAKDAITILNPVDIYKLLADIPEDEDDEPEDVEEGFEEEEEIVEPDKGVIAALLLEHFTSLAREDSEVTYPDPPPTESWINVSDLDLDRDLIEMLDVVTTTDIHLSSGATVESIRDVEVLEFVVDDRGTVSTVEFKLVLLGDVEVDGYDLDNDGEIVMQHDWLTNLRIVVPFIVDVVDNEALVGEPEQTGAADVSSREELNFRV